IAPGAATRLFFLSRLGYATTDQTARVQARPSGGSWTDLWTLAGQVANEPVQGGFELVSLDLAGFAGSEIEIRFVLSFGSGSYYGDPSGGSIGWFIDNIQIDTAFTPERYDGVGEPTAEEVLTVEYINRARADAVAEAARLRATSDADVLGAYNHFNVDLDLMEAQFAELVQTVPPLAINARLTAAARLHSEDMFLNTFQGHVSSSSPVAPNQPGDGSGDRISRQGYTAVRSGENVFAHAESPWHAHAAFNVDWGNGTGGMQEPPGHRISIHNGAYREIGVGIHEGTKTVDNVNYGPLLMTQNFGASTSRDGPFLVGVAYLDSDGDSFYSAGEGIADVRIWIEGGTHYTHSSSEGAYAVPLPGDGDYTVVFGRPGYAPVVHAFSVTGSASVKVDYTGSTSLTGVEVRAVDYAAPGQLALSVAFDGDASALQVEASADLESWQVVTASVSEVEKGLFEVLIDFDPATVGFFRLGAAP
ncbi:MAG: CAP domain-containing protein, partial [Opitutales bacterium]